MAGRVERGLHFCDRAGHAQLRLVEHHRDRVAHGERLIIAGAQVGDKLPAPLVVNGYDGCARRNHGAGVEVADRDDAGERGADVAVIGHGAAGADGARGAGLFGMREVELGARAFQFHLRDDPLAVKVLHPSQVALRVANNADRLAHHAGVGPRLRALRVGSLPGARPAHLAQSLRLLEALEVAEPAIDVLDALHAAGDLPGGLGDEDLARPRGRADARRQVHHASEVVAALLDRLARVDADPDRDAGPRLALGPLADRPLDGDRAQDAAARRRERDHEAVALGLHDGAAEGLDLLAHDGVVLAEHAVRGLVAVLLRVLGEAADVAEEDRDGAAVRHRRRGRRLRGPRALLPPGLGLHVAL